jgi:hypothetical protein
LEPLSTARKKKDLFIAIAGAKRKTPSLTGDEDLELALLSNCT